MGPCSVASLEGRKFAVGAATIGRLAWLLGLDKTPEPFRVRSAAWVEDHVELSVGVDAEREIVFVLERPRDGETPFVVTEKLALRYRGKELPTALSRLIGAVAPKKFVGLTMERIASVVAADPELGDAKLAMPASGNPHPANQLDTWGASDAWADFFAGGEIARGQLDSIDPTKLFSFIQHCDNECLIVNPNGPAPLISMVDYPWGSRGRAPGEVERPRHPVGDDGEDSGGGDMLTTELTEKDVILGNPGKVREVLEIATSRPNLEGKIIFFSNTCIPTVTGEDVESVVREFQRKSPVPLLYLTVTPKAMNDVFVDMFVTRRKRAEELAGPPEPRTINLLGFPDHDATRELVALLARFGVRVNVKLIPDLDLARIEQLPRAALSVYRPNSVWAHYYEQLGMDSKVPQLTLDAPFGWLGTERWLRAVLGALGMPFDEALWQQHTAPLEARMARAKARAKTHRLGLIVRAEELHYLTTPAHTWGIPLLAVAQELGFGVDVLLHVRTLDTAGPLVDQLAAKFVPGASNLVVPFRTLEELQTVLPKLGCEAVLTHHFFDWRLSERGKNRFSLQHFELGVEGALRTAERLDDICETRFYAKYQRYLRRTREGLRAAAPQAAAPRSTP
jgi:hypothetical protein